MTNARRLHRFKTVMSLMCIMLTVTGGCGHRTALRQPATPTTTATARADATRPAAWYQLITVSEATADLRDQDDIQNDPVETVFAVYPSYSNLGLSREEAFKVLLVTNTYAPGVFEGGARTSGQCWAMRTLFQQPDVRDALLDLLNRAGMAGQLHALLGLYLLDRPAFDRHAPRYQADRRGVNTFFGCIHVERRVCDVVGAFRYINTKDALRDLQE